MIKINRRNFLRAAAASAGLGAFPPSIQRALAIPANNRTGTIQDIEHVVIFMQENRSFDHYFGMLPGVRGYSDRFTIPMASGKPVWYQNATSSRVLQPFYLNPTAANSNGANVGGAHSWSDQQNAWDQGRMASWPNAKSLDASMGYLLESDLSYHWALAKAFTLCDAYYTSQHCGTFPNRAYMWSGTNGSSVSNYNLINNDGIGYTVSGNTIGPSAIGLTWTTYPERLQAAGISWKVYQRYNDNSNNNQLAPFASYRAGIEAANAQGYPVSTPYSATLEAISPLIKGVGNTLPTTGPGGQGDYLQAFIDDINAGQLPQVSWIVAPAKQSEHPGSSIPDEGAYWIETVLNALTANPDIWSKTVLLVNYDENDAFFDHVPPPCPPSPNGDGSYAGKSTVDVSNEYYTKSVPPIESAAATPPAIDGRPFGPCVRVPMLVISPWSVGGWVNSQTFDHTSTLRFLEQRFGIQESNISPWRRAVFGDMTNCFDFKNPDNALPALVNAPTLAQANAFFTTQTASGTATPAATLAGATPLPQQPLAVRPSRALPYQLHTSANVDASTGLVWLTCSNTGTQGAVFHVYDRYNLAAIPRRYTVEAGKESFDSWNPAANASPNTGKYSLWVLGPNGYHRLFEGSTAGPGNGASPEVRVCYDHANTAVYLTVMNLGNSPATLTISANAYRTDGPWTYTVNPGMQVEPSWSLADSQGWYDFTLSDGAGFVRRFAGRLETGKDSVSDPAMGV